MCSIYNRDDTFIAVSMAHTQQVLHTAQLINIISFTTKVKQRTEGKYDKIFFCLQLPVTCFCIRLKYLIIVLEHSEKHVLMKYLWSCSLLYFGFKKKREEINEFLCGWEKEEKFYGSLKLDLKVEIIFGFF